MLVSLKFGKGRDENGGGFSLWVPLFILGPIALVIFLALFLIALPFILVATLITWQLKWIRWIVYGIPAFFNTVNELVGLKVDVEDSKQKIYIAIH
jgi:hypothetical protein